MINKIYLERENFNEMKKIYSQTRVLVLDNFFEDLVYKKLLKLIDIKGYKKYRADKYSYEEIENEISDFFGSEFEEFLEGITEKKGFKLSFKKFSWKDYTLIHDEEGKDGVDFFFFVSDSWKDEWGGYKVYTAEEPMIFSVQSNRLCIIDRNGLNDFVKYVNNKAEGCFVLVEGNVPAEI